MARLLSMLALALATAFGYLYFPGHHYLQQDTQIWLPVLAHLQDPSLFHHELIVTGAHVRLSIFDDVTLALARLLGLSLETAMAGQQILFRFLALVGVWLVARGTKLSYLASVLAAVLCNLGAVVMGPAVLSVEYEPVPRGFAFGLTLLALGLLAHERYWPAGFALGLGFAYHAPAVWPVLLVAAWVSWREKKQRHWGLWLGFSLFVLILAVSALLSEAGPMNPLFARLSREHAELQQFRASYNWVTLWGAPVAWLTQFAVLAVMAALAVWRLGKALPKTVRPYLIALPSIGLLSVPLSYLLLEQAQLALLPQIQIMRALLFTLMIAVILMTLAGLRAASQGRWWEAPLWLGLVCFIPMAPVWTGKIAAVYLVAAALALGASLALMLEKRHPRAAIVGVALVLGACFFAPPYVAKVKNYTVLGDEKLDALVRWAKLNTRKDDVFLFRDAGTRGEPGLFRARALRAVYVDWKGGGQVNYYEFYAKEWWRRWQRYLKPPFEESQLPELRAAGVRYLVFRKEPKALASPVYDNGGYHVYRIDEP